MTTLEERVRWLENYWPSWLSPGRTPPRALSTPGSPEWTRGMMIALRTVCKQALIDEVEFGNLWSQLSSHRVWESFPPDKPFGDPDTLLKEVLGESMVSLRARMTPAQLAADPTTPALEKPGAPLGNKNASKAHQLAADAAVALPSLGDNVSLPTSYGMNESSIRNKAQALAANPVVGPLAGNKRAKSTIVSRGSNQAEYLVRRLKRDAPEIAAALGRGEYRSARAAAIAAGIVRKATAFDVLCRAWNRATPDERQRFREWQDTEPRHA